MFTMGDWYERYNFSSFMRPIDMPDASATPLAHAHLPADIPSHSRAALDAQVHSLVHAMAASFAPPAVEIVLHGNALQHQVHIPLMAAGPLF